MDINAIIEAISKAAKEFGLNLPIIAATIAATWATLRAFKKQFASPEFEISIPFAWGIIFYILWDWQFGTVQMKTAFTGLLNAFVAVGLFSVLESYAKKRGWISE